MYESDIQTTVSKAIIDGKVDRLNLCISDSENIVIVDTGDRDAAYTADEARHLAESIENISDQHWNTDNSEIVEYIHDLADVVDNEKEENRVQEKWEKKKMETGHEDE